MKNVFVFEVNAIHFDCLLGLLRNDSWGWLECVKWHLNVTYINSNTELRQLPFYRWVVFIQTMYLSNNFISVIINAISNNITLFYELQGK